ncbi:MAG: TolB family protein [Terriglobia bacterium]
MKPTVVFSAVLFFLLFAQAGCGGGQEVAPAPTPPPPPSPGSCGAITRVSVDSSGAQANGLSDRPSLSADGRYVAFEGANASNLVPGDTNGVADVFVHDRQTGIIVRVSVDSAGAQSNNGSAFASLSADGRLVAFQSIATNLVPGDTNGQIDVFVHDRDADGDGVFDEPGAITTTRVSVDSSGAQVSIGGGAPSLSADGRYVAFMSPASDLVPGDTNGTWDVFVHDRQTGATTRVSVDSSGAEGNSLSTSPALSADGRFVAFASAASNLVAGDTNGAIDVFVHDRDADGDGVFDEPGAITTTRVSVDSGGAQGNNNSGVLGSDEDRFISADGRFVAFVSAASNLVPGDTNGFTDVFVHDRQTGITTRVSVDSGGVQANAASFSPQINPDGRFVVFGSLASNLVTGDTNGFADVFVHDRDADGDGVFDEPGGISTTRVSVSNSCEQGNDHSAQGDAGFEPPALSADGRFVAFASFASNLVASDTNGFWDIFVHDQTPNDGP